MFKQHVIKELSAYCHGELSIEDSRRVADHLLICQRCRKEFEAIRLGVLLAGHLPRLSAPASIWNEIEVSLGKTDNPMTSRQKSPGFARITKCRSLAVACAVLLLMLGVALMWHHTHRPTASWEVTSIEGRPKVGSNPIEKIGHLAAGEWLETDSNSRARIHIGEIGHAEVEPNTRVRLIKTRSTEHRLGLAHGVLHARVLAPPRLFFVETPSAVAVDLGCAYTLEVNKAGAGMLDVTSGWVAFKMKGRESIVPSGASCETRPGIGPGTPFFKSASEAFLTALERLDFEKSGHQVRMAALSVVLAESRQRDALTLWHLMSRVKGPERSLVYDRLAALVPPPEGVTREGVLKGDRLMRDLWWDKLGPGNITGWRLRKGPRFPQPQ